MELFKNNMKNATLGKVLLPHASGAASVVGLSLLHRKSTMEIWVGLPAETRNVKPLLMRPGFRAIIKLG